MAIDLILGTAGHIDHGKTSSVRALTGVDTDRLPEEKRRGITIELGFAELTVGDVRLGIVDVPGHERFVRNMLAGATGIDLALLVVAADDSVKPQTREHLDILKLLNVPAGVIALTKCDLSDPNWIDLVEDEIRDLVADSFLAEAPIVRTSAQTGAGLEELIAALTEQAKHIAAQRADGANHAPLRMAIDRTFTIAGHGTVVTGSVASGAVQVGDELSIMPGGRNARVRGLQRHDLPVERIERGQRAAINLAGVHHDQIQRGHELATPGFLQESKLLTVMLRMVDSAPRPLKSRSRARLHVGAAEIMASVVLLENDELPPGLAGLAQLYLAEPAVTAWNQPFVLRRESPLATIGGGQVLDPNAAKIRRHEVERIAKVRDLVSTDPAVRASAALYLTGPREWNNSDLTRLAGIDQPAPIIERLTKAGSLRPLAVSPTRSMLVHAQVIDDLSQRVEATLGKLHDQFPLNAMIERARLNSRLEYLGGNTLIDAILQDMSGRNRIKLSGRGVALAGHGPQLSAAEQQLVEQLIERYRQSGFQPPTVKELQQETRKHQASVPQLINLAAAEGHLVQIDPELYLHGDAEGRMKQTLSERLSGSPGLTVSQIREILETTRKYAVPFCEYLDRIGFTRRNGDVRVLVENRVAPA